MYQRACALTLFVTASLCHEFFFSKSSDAYRRTEDCQMCYLDKCFTLETARCEYYAQADDMIYAEEEVAHDVAQLRSQDKEAGENDIKLKTEVDEMLYNLVERASDMTDKDCIPYLSQYTDCDKENICLGCTSCNCDSNGRWNCTEVHMCRAEKALNVDHRVLLMVMENLMNSDDRQSDKIRSRRAVTENPPHLTTNTLTYEDLAEMWYGVETMHHNHQHSHVQNTKHSTQPSDINKTIDKHINMTEENNTTIEDNITTKDAPLDILNTTQTDLPTIPSSETAIITDADNLAFEEVLSNIGIDQSYIRRKLPIDLLQNETVSDIDYMMILGNNNIALYQNLTAVDPSIFNIVEEEGDSVEETTKGGKVVIDLLESAKKRNVDVKNVSDYIEIDKDSFDLNPPFENTNDIMEYDALNIMKREVSKVEHTAESVNKTTQAYGNITDAKCNLNTTVLYSLSELISGVHRELKELQFIKGNLINLTQAYNNTVFGHNITCNDANNVNVASEIENDSRRNNPNILELYIDKLKRDIYEVLRDVVGIQKYKNISELPEELKPIIRSMKRYVGKEFKSPVNNNKVQVKKSIIDFRRYGSIYRESSSPRDYVIKILNTIDGRMPKTKALHSLSSTAKKIISRIISQHYIDDFSAIGLRPHDPSYNLTEDLQSVGRRWQELAANVETSSPHEKPFCIKLLHLSLIEDTSKMKEALALVNFAHSRRAIPIFRQLETDTAERIRDGLQHLNEKIEVLLQVHNRMSSIKQVTQKPYVITKSVVNVEVDTRRQKQKKSFLNQIRNLLRGSKKDIVDLLNKRVPKADIIKKIAKKKMNALAQKRYDEYEETMKRWQKNLDVHPRKRRSMLDTNGFRAQMKNIIPKYLRGKVDRKIDVKKKNQIVPVNNNRTRKPKNKVNTVNVKGNKPKQTPNPVTRKLTTSSLVKFSDY